MKYDVILADPPWSFKSWNANTGPKGRTAAKHYPVMDHADIANFPINDLAKENCALFLWVVWPSLPECMAVGEQWGFTYRTIAWLWAKARRSGFGFHFGLGYYTRANTEPCLLFVKGRMPVAVKDVMALIYSPVREHSRKPDEQYGKIERLYPNMDCVELFARQKREGWHSWGNEVKSDLRLETKGSK